MSTPLIAAAFFVIYVVWGSTFLGIRIVVEQMPPLGVAAVRFLAAGLILLALAGKRVATPTLKQWRNAALVGGLFFFGNHSFVGTASRVLPSSVVALIIATEVPIIALLSAAFVRGERLTWRVVLGSVLGLLGVASLFINVRPGEQALPVVPSLMVLAAATSWSIGAVLSQRLDAPQDALLRSGMQMTSGGVFLALGSIARGETFTAESFNARTLWTLAYLVLIGSVLAFACYQWLLQHVRTEAVATHVFVNPLVATVLGAWVGGEQLRMAQLAAGALILMSVLVIMYRRTGPKAS